MSGTQLFYALHQRPWSRNIIQRKITIQPVQAQGTLDLRMYEDSLQFRPEIKIFAEPRKVKRFDPHSIASQHQPAAGLRPKRHGKHTAISNAVFDSSLRDTNAEWGVRDIEALERLAASSGLALIEISKMPANNLILAFGRPKA